MSPVDSLVIYLLMWGMFFYIYHGMTITENKLVEYRCGRGDSHGVSAIFNETTKMCNPCIFIEYKCHPVGTEFPAKSYYTTTMAYTIAGVPQSKESIENLIMIHVLIGFGLWMHILYSIFSTTYSSPEPLGAIIISILMCISPWMLFMITHKEV